MRNTSNIMILVQPLHLTFGIEDSRTRLPNVRCAALAAPCPAPKFVQVCHPWTTRQPRYLTESLPNGLYGDNRDMIEPRSVVHFSIPVSDLDASRKFYTEILGLTHIQDSPKLGLVFLRAGDDHVVLAKSDSPLERTPIDSRRAHHAFKVDADRYDHAKTFLASRGVEVFEEEDRKRGVFVGRQFYIRDPDGTVIEFTEWDGTSILD